MNSKALQHISASISAQTAFAPYGFRNSAPTPTRLSNYISNVQFERLAHDVRMWREVVREMELAYYPMRVKAQRMFMDTVENPYVKALLERYKESSLQRDYIVYNVDSNGKRIKSDVLSQQLSEQFWVSDYIEGVHDAILYGYTLIELGDIVNDSFPNITYTRRENIRPDGLGEKTGPILTSLVYAVDGVHVTKDPLISMCNHWVPTKSTRGVSTCGYGLLYNIALFEIHLRHIVEWNMDYVQNYGQPIKKGSTNKTGKDRQKFEAFLRNGASSNWVLLDKAMGDDVVYEMVDNAGTAWKSYENVETRLQGVLAQNVLGHTDAMKSTPGKLGGNQASNKDGDNVNFIQAALNAKQTRTGNFIARKMNQEFAPRMRQLGRYVGSKTIKDLIPVGYSFALQNDAEENEVKRRDNEDKIKISTWVKTLSDAGWDIENPKDLNDRMGIKMKAVIPERKLIEERNTNSTITKATPNE